MLSYLENFPNFHRFEEFPKYPLIWEISKILIIYHPKIPIEIWEISGMPQIPGNFGNSQIPIFFKSTNAVRSCDKG